MAVILIEKMSEKLKLRLVADGELLNSGPKLLRLAYHFDRDQNKQGQRIVAGSIEKNYRIGAFFGSIKLDGRKQKKVKRHKSKRQNKRKFKGDIG